MRLQPPRKHWTVTSSVAHLQQQQSWKNAVTRLHTSSERLRPCRHYFALFLWLETGAIAVSAAVAVARLRQSGHKFSEGNLAITWTAVFLIIDVFLLLSVGALSLTQVRDLQMTGMES